MISDKGPPYYVTMRMGNDKFYGCENGQAGGPNECYRSATFLEARRFASQMNHQFPWEGKVHWDVERLVGKLTVSDATELGMAFVKKQGVLGIMQINVFEADGPDAFARCEEWAIANEGSISHEAF